MVEVLGTICHQISACERQFFKRNPSELTLLSVMMGKASGEMSLAQFRAVEGLDHKQGSRHLKSASRIDFFVLFFFPRDIRTDLTWPILCTRLKTWPPCVRHLSSIVHDILKSETIHHEILSGNCLQHAKI